MFAEAVLWIARTGSPGLGDNILTPLMLSGGLDVPMPIILIGVIVGMISDGLLGLFVGPVLPAISYMLLMEWIQQQSG